MANDEVIGPRKTMFVLVIVVGCFAVLWPRILSPLVLGPSREQMQPNQFDREAGCCEVIFETDVAILELVNEVCSSSLGVGLLSPQSAAECRKAVNDTCGVDIAVFLKRNENVGKTTKMLVETMQNSNSSCLREHFGVPVYSLGHHLASKAWDIKDTLKQERAPPIRGMGPHPALRERGRAIPPGPPGPPPPPASKPIALPPHVRVRSPLSVYYEDEQPPPIPGMRPPLGSPGGPVPAPKSSMGFVMPIYTICIIVFFVYTLSKILFRRTASPYDPVAPDPQFRRRVFRDDSRSSPDKLGKKEADTIVTAISGLVAEVQQQMEASTAQNQQRQDVQDNARPYTNGTILLNSGPVQIVASEYKDALKDKTSEPVNEKESTPEPKETEPIKVAKEPEHDVVAPECNERTVETKEPSPEVSKPSPEPVEQNEATPETVVEESPLESLQTKEIRQPSPEPKESTTTPSVDKDPSPELISQLAEASLESETIEPSVTESESSSDHKETTSTFEQPISEPEVVKEPTPEPTSQDIQISLDPSESIDTLPTEHSTQPKDISPELYLAEPKQPSPEPKEPLLDTEEIEELVLVPNESTQEPKDSVLELIESVSKPIQSIPESIVSQSQDLILERNEILPKSEEIQAQPKEPSSDSNESLTLVEESLESKELDPKVNASIESEELVVSSLLTDAIEHSLDLKAPADTKLEISTPEILGSLSEIDTTIPEHKSPTTDTTDSIPHNKFTPDTEHIQEVDAPEVDRSTEPLDDTSTLKEPTPQSKPSSEPEGTVEISPPQVKNAAFILEEAIAEIDDATADIKTPEKSTLEETKEILDETNKPQVSKETLQHLDESIAELDDATAKLQEKTIEKGSPDRSEAEDDVNAEVLKVFEASDALEESPKQTTDKFLKNERFTVTKRTTPEHIEDMKGKPIELLTPTETPAAFKVLGMETTAHRVDNSAWPRDLPAPSPAPPHRPPHEAEEVQSIFLETEIPQQSRVLVAQFEEDRQESRDKPQPAKHAPLVVSGKMTLSLIQDAPRDTPERDPESTYDEFTTASAVTQPAAEKGEIESDEEIDEEIEVEEIEEEIEEEEEEEEPPSPNPAAKK